MGNTFLQICRCGRAKDGGKVDSTHSSTEHQEEIDSSLDLNVIHKENEDGCKEQTSSFEKIKELIASPIYIGTQVHRDIPPPSSNPIEAVDTKGHNLYLDDIDWNSADSVISDDIGPFASPLDSSEEATLQINNSSTKIDPHVESDMPLSPSKPIESVDSKPQNASPRFAYDCVIQELKEIFKHKSLSRDMTNYNSFKSDISDYSRPLLSPPDSFERPPTFQINTSTNIGVHVESDIPRSLSGHVVIIDSKLENAPHRFACDCVVQELQERFKGKNLPHDNTNWNSVQSDISDGAYPLASPAESSERQSTLQSSTSTNIGPHIGRDMLRPLSKPVVINDTHPQNLTPRLAYNCVIHELKERSKHKNLLNINTNWKSAENDISDDVRPLSSPPDSSEGPPTLQINTPINIDCHVGKEVPKSLLKPIVTVASNPKSLPSRLSYDCVILDLKKRFKRKYVSHDDTNWNGVENDISDGVRPLLPDLSGENAKFQITSPTNIGPRIRRDMSQSISKPTVLVDSKPQNVPPRFAYGCVIQELKERFTNRNLSHDVTNRNSVESDISNNVRSLTSPPDTSEKQAKLTTTNTGPHVGRDMPRSPSKSAVTVYFKPQYGIMFILVIILFIKLLYSCTAE